MKKITFILVAIGVSAALPLIVLGASANLYNGGFGQTAGNTSQFGVAICNGGTTAINQSVPVSVAVGAQTATISSVASITAKSCAYSYSQYGALGMEPGKTYSVVVTIDPTHSVISNKNNQATYSVTVPGGATASGAEPSTGAGNGTADVGTQSNNFFTAILQWFEHIF